MRRLAVATVVLGGALLTAPAQAATLFECSNPSTIYRTVCNDAELRALAGEIDGEFARLLRGADPLTAMLLKRDQDWFVDMLAAGNLLGFEGQNDAVYARLLVALKARRRALARLRSGPVATPEGHWSNVFAGATIVKADGVALTIKLDARLSYPDENRGEVTCAVTATAAPGKDGWYSATLDEKKDAKGNTDVIRFRPQGNTLRVIREPSDRSTVCTATALGGDESERRQSADVLTGSYFASGPAIAAGAGAAGAVAPSFDCAHAEKADEMEICADPDLAAADAEIAKVYRETMRRLDRKFASYLRADQRAWASDNSDEYRAQLQPGSDKEQSTVHHTSLARAELFWRQQARKLMLANLDETRQGLEGLWVGHDASLSIGPAKGKSDGTLHAQGGKGVAGDYKSYCTYEGTGKIENGEFDAPDFPTLTRDGAMLVVAAEEPDGDSDHEQPGYCNRQRSAKARMFPVKAGSGIEAAWQRMP